MPCREHWLQLQQRNADLESLGIAVYIVTFDEPALARFYADTNELNWPLLIDPDRKVYQGFGMGRASWWTLMKPSMLWRYFKIWLKGTRPQKVGSDVHQLGGDVLIDPAGVLRLNHVSQNPHDRPAIQDLIDLVEADSPNTGN